MSFQNSHPEGSPHHFLAQLIGGWVGKTRTWLEPEGTPSESPVQGSIQLVLEGRFVLYLYQSTMDSEPQQGIYTFGYNTTLNRYESSWVDSYHNNTAIMFCVGESRKNGFSVLGSYPSSDDGPDWGWRTEVELIERDHLKITAYNITPEGQEAKASETQLRRVK